MGNKMSLKKHKKWLGIIKNESQKKIEKYDFSKEKNIYSFLNKTVSGKITFKDLYTYLRILNLVVVYVGKGKEQVEYVLDFVGWKYIDHKSGPNFPYDNELDDFIFERIEPMDLVVVGVYLKNKKDQKRIKFRKEIDDYCNTLLGARD